MLYTLHQRPHSDAFSAIYSSITFRDSSSAVFFPYRFHLQIPSRQSFSYSWATPSRQYTIGLLFISPSHALSISLFNSISSPSNFKGSPPACPLHWIRWLRLYHSLFGPLAIPYRIINFHHL